MSSLRPTSDCDTTLLQSSVSEPSSPTLNGTCVLAVGVANSTNDSAATTTTTLSNHNHNNNKIEVRLNSLLNGGIGVGGGSGEQRQMDFNGTRHICGRLFVDLIILACVGLPILGFSLWGETFQRGFFCDDESLKHPYRESTIHSWMLYLMGLVLPIAIIIAVEFFKANSNKMRGFGNLTEENYYFCHFELPGWIVECYKKIGVLIFGAGVVKLTTDVAKYSVGRLRPHFFAVCQPLMPNATTCADASNAARYIEEFTCQGSDTVSEKLLKEVRLSFPSGHASVAFFTMIYIAMYLQTRMTWQRAKMFKHLLQFLFLMFAWYTSLTRVSDYKHHWTDVLAGSTIGTVYAILAICMMW